MATGHYIGLGDKTTCGGTVLQGDNRINLYGVLHSCEGDLVSCGIDGKSYQIYGGISHMTSHGRRMAGTLDSFSGCLCKAKLIPSVFTATYENEVRPVPRTSTSITQPTNHSDKSSRTSSQLTEAKPSAKSAASSSIPKANSTTCDHPDQMEALAAYIASEMNTNINSAEVKQMRELTSFDAAAKTREYEELPFYLRLGPGPNFHSMAASMQVKAFAIWTERVGQNRPWDHKPIIRRTVGGIRHKQGTYDYFYDIWSNVHYGYVGMAGGLSESVLLDGAGAEQIISDAKRKVEEVFTIPKAQWELPGPNRSADVEGLRAWDDAPDRISISIGVKLYQQHPNGGITSKMVMDEVLAVPLQAWGKGVQIHVCQ